MKTTIIAAAACITMLSGCATKTVQLNSGVGAAYRGKTITYSYHETPDFSAVTAGKASFGAIGAVGMVNSGNTIIAENKVPDPAATIGVTIATDLANKYGLTLVHPKSKTSNNKVPDIAADYKEADLVLDVQTRGWGFSYLPMDWNNYYTFYSARLKLIDTKQAEELAAGSFSYDSRDAATHPSKDQLLGNQAAGLKNELLKAQSQCITETRQRIFNAR